eukprot:11089332-Heterocapsa_arctica.AAC.1
MESNGIGNNGADELANRAAKLVGPSVGQGKHYLNRQKLCKFVQQIQAKILEQVQSVEAMPVNGQSRRKQDLSGYTVTAKLRNIPPPRLEPREIR